MSRLKGKQKKYIVTGGCGFIGSHIAEALLRDGHKVVVVDNLYSGFEEFLPKDKNLTFVKADISDWEDFSRNYAYFQNSDGVFHLAAIARIQPSIYNPELTHRYNVTGTLNVLEVMRMCNIPNIVYSASSSYYGKAERLPLFESDPPACETPYAITKYMGELYCKTWGKLHGIQSVCLRYFNVYGRRSPLTGPYAPVIGLFFRQIVTGNPMTIVGDGEQSRDFTHVGDVARANLMAMEKLEGQDSVDADGLTINIGTGKNYTINEVAKMVGDEMSSYEPSRQNIPHRVGETKATLADTKLAKQILEWEPLISLDKGIKDLRSYYNNRADKLLNGERAL
jgi:UDP-glucose 4-epimerase